MPVILLDAEVMSVPITTLYKHSVPLQTLFREHDVKALDSNIILHRLNLNVFKLVCF